MDGVLRLGCPCCVGWVRVSFARGVSFRCGKIGCGRSIVCRGLGVDVGGDGVGDVSVLPGTE